MPHSYRPLRRRVALTPRIPREPDPTFGGGGELLSLARMAGLGRSCHVDWVGKLKEASCM